MANLRFYTHSSLAIGTSIQLSESAATHATRALRLNVGDNAIVFNGDGYDYVCELSAIKKNTVLVNITAAKKIENESPLHITLIQAISSADRMDFTIQKAVELGVNAIQPISSQRSVVKLSAERAEKRTEHWQKIAISACEQSGRAFVPPVYSPLNYSTLFSHLKQTVAQNACKIILDPTASQNLNAMTRPSGHIYLLIGAEGGLTDEEIALATTQHFQGIQLGTRILRTETAALAAISAMQTLWGDF